MAGLRTNILIISLSSVLAIALFTLPDNSPPASGAFAKCTACHPGQADELKRAPFHASMQCSDCHSLNEFRQDLRSHNATTLACTRCHGRIPEMTDQKPLDHTSFNLIDY
ncbi:MAG: hypothetical protein O8C64_07260 [Candidatus Methanoperedens sp.]|nr:hypothetical protein [Candidatus Methanoperedens sp.]MCZ7384005.1 hypothetical protein [Candidatus Methanoperedens sp.]MCZ7405331.1 hypothetical protein [Candidatus Methanoperedens sp.]